MMVNDPWLILGAQNNLKKKEWGTHIKILEFYGWEEIPAMKLQIVVGTMGRMSATFG